MPEHIYQQSSQTRLLQAGGLLCVRKSWWKQQIRWRLHLFFVLNHILYFGLQTVLLYLCTPSASTEMIFMVNNSWAKNWIPSVSSIISNWNEGLNRELLLVKHHINAICGLCLKPLFNVFVQRKSAFLCRSPYDQTAVPADHPIWQKKHNHFWCVHGFLIAISRQFQ